MFINGIKRDVFIKLKLWKAHHRYKKELYKRFKQKKVFLNEKK